MANFIGPSSWSLNGAVLQVVQGTYATETTSTTSTFADTGLSASITPSSTSSKILVLVSQPYALTSGSANNCTMYMRLYRGGTLIQDNRNRFDGYTGAYQGVWNTSYLDSPATTSATTYKTQFNLHDTGSSRNTKVNFENKTSTIILLEVGA